MQFMKSHFHQYYNNLEKTAKLATSSVFVTETRLGHANPQVVLPPKIPPKLPVSGPGDRPASLRSRRVPRLSRRHGMGRHVWVCLGASCRRSGAPEALARLEQ